MITHADGIILALLKVNPKKFRVLYPLLKSNRARLLALKIRRDAINAR